MNKDCGNLDFVFQSSKFSKTFWVEAQKLPFAEQYRYHLYGIYHYNDKLDFDRLSNALQCLVDNNYNLRSNFRMNKDVLEQVIHKRIQSELVNIRYETEEEKKEKLDDLIRKPFDLETDKLFRFAVFENFTNNEYTLVLLLLVFKSQVQQFIKN